jgi:glycolate oxidase FAD binding subunit
VVIVPTPQNPRELANALRDAASHGRTIALGGNGSKRRMAGPIPKADESISTKGLQRVLQYEPHDLTISVEAGLPWRELTRVLAGNRQMVPLDPPFAATSTVGGVIASNSSGPRRRLYGTARDLVIGMQFATLEGKLVSSGGMVVKNVAGLDMGKLLIGSFGTLAAIAVVNFKLSPMPELERSFLLPFESLSKALAARDRIIASALQPAALDLLNPLAGATLGNSAWLLAIRAGGNAAVINRYERELAPFGDGAAFEGPHHDTLWRHVEDFTPRFLEEKPDGAVIRASCTLKGLEAVMESFQGPSVARAGTGVCYGYFQESRAASAWLAEAATRGWKAVVEYSRDDREASGLWLSPGGDFAIMQRVKNLFDPGNLLNRGRLYGRI